MNYEALFKLSYGLYIVSAKHGDIKNGYIANTVFQVTAEPPQLAISCSKDNFSEKLIRDSGKFSVSILRENADSSLIGNFGYKSGREINKFIGIDYFVSSEDIPVVMDNCVAWFTCEITQIVDVDTHTLFIGRIINNDLLSAKKPLTYDYYRNVKKAKSPKNAPTYIDESKLSKNNDVKTSDSLRYECPACGYVYNSVLGDPDGGIAPGTKFEDIPDDWECPICGIGKEDFEQVL